MFMSLFLGSEPFGEQICFKILSPLSKMDKTNKLTNQKDLI